MYNTTTDIPTRAFEAPNESTQIAQQDAMLSPRFYTTDFEAVNAAQDHAGEPRRCGTPS